jgi:GNAT superfamily N-acetyltransferase
VSDEAPATGPQKEPPRAQVRLAQQVGPAQVGRRVVVRRRLPDGSAGDLLGDLIRWDDETVEEPLVTVRTRAGDVTVPAADVLGGTPVPQPPARRGRPHRTIDWRELEDVASDGWRPIEQQTLGPRGWRLRAAHGFTGRANSVLVIGDPGLPLPEAVDRAESWYAERGLPPRFALPWPPSVRRLGEPPGSAGVDTDVDRLLADRGYRVDTPTLVLTAATREVAVAATPLGAPRTGAGTVDAVALESQPDDEWLAVYHYRGQQLPAVARRLLLSAPEQVFASVRDGDGRTVAVARGASSRGWTGVTAMEVRPQHRRHGLAHLLLGRLASWAAERGDASLYLQVSEANTAARALYESVGFATHHGYHYRVR